MNRNTPAPNTCAVPTPLRVEAVFVEKDGETEHHRVKFDWANLDERWVFTVRLEDCLRQGYGVAMAKIDPKVERLSKRYKVT
jgi:hypothetical protein